jgi:hypothetical protein
MGLLCKYLQFSALIKGRLTLAGKGHGHEAHSLSRQGEGYAPCRACARIAGTEGTLNQSQTWVLEHAPLSGR